MFLLSKADPWFASRLVQAETLSVAGDFGAARGIGRIRHRPSRRRRSSGQRFHRNGALSGSAAAAGRHGELFRRATGGAGYARHDDRGGACDKSWSDPMTESADLVKRLPNDIGGLTAGPISKVDHELLPWEKRCHALADVLDFHKIINTEEKRRGVESLGTEMINALSYYERWIVAFANILFQKGLFTPEQLANKIAEIESRPTIA